jgi:RHS repeat-associated protein
VHLCQLLMSKRDIALLIKGTGYTVGDMRRFDAWGQVREGNTTGDPRGRYVANLGHKQDDESGLIYMRARYYEPSRGRFISEDPAMDGSNWFTYCGNDPISYGDPTGKAKISIGGIYWIEWQNKDGDLAWGEYRGGQPVQRGQYVGNGRGALKHGDEEYFNETVKKLLRNAKDPKVIRTLGKAGNIGLHASVLTTSLDSAFLSDPAAFSDLIDYVGGDWDLLGGFIRVSG